MLKYNITGNFQYDLGIFGIARVMNDFTNDNNIIYNQTDTSITIDLSNIKDEHIEDYVEKNELEKLATLIFVSYFKDYLCNLGKTLFPVNNEPIEMEEEFYNLLHSFFDGKYKTDIEINNFVNEVINLLQKYKQELEKYTQKEDEQKGIKMFFEEVNEIRSKLKKTNLTLLGFYVFSSIIKKRINNIMLNFYGNNKEKIASVFKISKIDKKTENNKKLFSKKYNCSFCGKDNARIIARDCFFFAHPFLNLYWNNIPNIFICEQCIISNLAIAKSFLIEKLPQFMAVYLDNLSTMNEFYENNIFTNSSKDNYSDNCHKNNDSENYYKNDYYDNYYKIVNKIMLESNLNIIKGNNELLANFLVIQGTLDSQEPNFQITFITSDVIDKYEKIKGILEKIYKSNKSLPDIKNFSKNSKKLKKVKMYYIVTEALLNNISFLDMFKQYATLALESYNNEIQKIKSATITDISAENILVFIGLHAAITGEQFYKEIIELGKEIGKQIKAKYNFTHTKLNRIKSRKLELAFALFQSGNSDYRTFLETLTITTIKYDISIKKELLDKINSQNYQNVAMILAIAILVEEKNYELFIDSIDKDL